MRKIQIAVIGYNEDNCTDTARNIAYEVGKEIALSNSVLICGGLGGVMESACMGAQNNGGMTVGIIPQDDSSYANKYCDIVLSTGLGYSRNFIIATSADAIITVGGGVGTLNELSVGYMLKKIMVVISGTGGIADEYAGKYLDGRKMVKIEKISDPKKAVTHVIKQLKNSQIRKKQRKYDI